jgi:NADH:ubiquinone oxidoreductase subunit 5 (subunit L)/multisubunit Na+/H+ antiporter MnhA subunit
LSRLFSRSFVADSAIALIIIGVILAVLILVAFLTTSLFFYKRHRGQKRQIRETEEETRNLEIELDVLLVYEDISTYGRLSYLYRTERLKQESFKESSSSQSITLISLFFLPLSMVLSFFGMTSELKPSTTSFQPKPPLETVGNPRAAGLYALLFPRSNSSLKDLDQKVAVFAGLTVLAFSLYSILSVWYAEWKKNQARDLQFDKRTI